MSLERNLYYIGPVIKDSMVIGHRFYVIDRDAFIEVSLKTFYAIYNAIYNGSNAIVNITSDAVRLNRQGSDVITHFLRIAYVNSVDHRYVNNTLEHENFVVPIKLYPDGTIIFRRSDKPSKETALYEEYKKICSTYRFLKCYDIPPYRDIQMNFYNFRENHELTCTKVAYKVTDRAPDYPYNDTYMSLFFSHKDIYDAECYFTTIVSKNIDIYEYLKAYETPECTFHTDTRLFIFFEDDKPAYIMENGVFVKYEDLVYNLGLYETYSFSKANNFRNATFYKCSKRGE